MEEVRVIFYTRGNTRVTKRERETETLPPAVTSKHRATEESITEIHIKLERERDLKDFRWQEVGNIDEVKIWHIQTPEDQRKGGSDYTTNSQAIEKINRVLMGDILVNGVEGI